jgi:hypothetical protein
VIGDLHRELKQMSDKEGFVNPLIKGGMLLFEDGIDFPQRMVFEERSYISGWACVEASAASRLGKQLNLAGWTFLCMAREIKVTTFGFNKEAMETRATRRLIRAAKSQACNCLEVSRVRTKQRLGVSALSMYAHARHVQQHVASWPTHSWTDVLRRCLWKS